MKKPVDVSPLEKHIGYWMRLVSNHVSHAFRQKLEAHGITVAEWVALRELLRVGEIAPSALAEIMGMTRGAISKVIDRLMEKELIDRTFDGADRRYQTLSLTRAGRLLIPKLAAIADRNDEEYFGCLTQRERDALLETLQEIVRRRELQGPPLS